MYLFVSVYLGVLTLSRKKWVKALDCLLMQKRSQLSRSKYGFNSALVRQINKQTLLQQKSATNLGQVNNYSLAKKLQILHLHPCSLH